MKWIVSIVVLAAVAGGIWLLRGGEAQQEGLEGPGVAQPSDVPVENPALEGPQPGDAQGARTLAGSGPGTVKNSAGEDEKRNANLNKDIRVLIVEAATGQAVPGADVWFLDRTDIPATEWQAVWPSGPVKEYIQSRGTQLTAGEDGAVAVPLSQNVGMYASAEGLAGQTAWIGPQSRVVRLGLRPSVDLVVQVIDSYGTPRINVPVGISRNVPGNPTPIITRLSNGAQATIRFTGLAKTLRSTGPPGFNVHFAFPLPYVERIPFQLESMPTEPIILTLPPTGSVGLSILSEDLRPFQQRGHAKLGLMEPNPVTGEIEFSPYATQEIRGGSAYFPSVGVNMDLHVRLDGGHAMRVYEGELRGPSQDGERVDHEIVWDGRKPKILGRAMLADGTTLALMTGGFSIYIDGKKGPSGAQVRTDDRGHFELSLPEDYTEGTERVLRIYLNAKDGESPRDAELSASFEVSLDGTDLGDVVFEGRPLLLSGSVRAADTGELLPRAHVRVEVADETGAYHAQPGLSIGTDKAGFFKLYGRTEAESFRVVVMRNEFLNLKVEPVEAGSTDVSLMMERGQETSSPLKGNPSAGDGK